MSDNLKASWVRESLAKTKMNMYLYSSSSILLFLLCMYTPYMLIYYFTLSFAALMVALTIFVFILHKFSCSLSDKELSAAYEGDSTNDR